MNSVLEQDSLSPYQKFRAFLNKKSIVITRRIIFALFNLLLIFILYNSFNYRLSLYTGFTLESLANYFSQPHIAKVSDREFELPPGFYLYEEPQDTTHQFLWAAVDINYEFFMYKEYYDLDNASYSDTCFNWFKDIALENSLNNINNLVAKYECGNYDVYISRAYSIAPGKVFMVDYEACIPEKRINFTYSKWSIFLKRYDYFKHQLKEICLSDANGELEFQEYITEDEIYH